MRLLAGRVGQVLNLSNLSNDVGVSSTPLKEWLSVLEASYLIYRLPPYYENTGKRYIKSPKIYFTDVGLACYLLEIEAPSQVARDPLCGKLFENMVVVEALKYRLNQGAEPSIYFFRDTKGHEVDLLFCRQRRVTPIEIKSAMTYRSDFLKGIRYYRRHFPDTPRGAVIYAGEMTPDLEEAQVLHYSQTAALLHRLATS